MNAAHEPLNWFRRAGRRTLRLFRPLALPFLHRLEWRIASGVERSATVIALQSKTDSMLRHQDVLLQRLNVAFAHLEAGQTKCAEKLEVLHAITEQLPIRLDTLSLGQIRTATFEKAVASLQEELRSGAAPALISALRAEIQAERHVMSRVEAAGQTAVSRLDVVVTMLRRFFIPMGEDVAIRTSHGYVLVPANDEALLLHAVESSGQLEPGTQNVLLALLQPGSSYVDVGANVGLLCLPAARQVGSDGSVIAVEPAPRTASLLRRTMALNDLTDRVTVIEAAAGAEEGRATLHIGRTSGWSTLLDGLDSVGEVEVGVRPLDAIIPPGGRVDVVKVDAEGYELQVLRGMVRVIADNPRLAVVVEFGPSHIRRAGGTIGAWLSAFQDHGLVPWEIDEATASLRPLRGTGLGDVVSMNLLFLRDSPASRPGLRLA